MKKPINQIGFVTSLLIITIIFLALPQLPKAQDDFIRQPPRKVIHTPHNRSDADPQQVSL